MPTPRSQAGPPPRPGGAAGPVGGRRRAAGSGHGPARPSGPARSAPTPGPRPGTGRATRPSATVVSPDFELVLVGLVAATQSIRSTPSAAASRAIGEVQQQAGRVAAHAGVVGREPGRDDAVVAQPEVAGHRRVLGVEQREAPAERAGALVRAASCTSRRIQGWAKRSRASGAPVLRGLPAPAPCRTRRRPGRVGVEHEPQRAELAPQPARPSREVTQRAATARGRPGSRRRSRRQVDRPGTGRAAVR